MRNSSGEVIQFHYGGDDLDPMMMEGRDKPVDFERILALVRASNPEVESDEKDEKRRKRNGILMLLTKEREEDEQFDYVQDLNPDDLMKISNKISKTCLHQLVEDLEISQDFAKEMADFLDTVSKRMKYARECIPGSNDPNVQALINKSKRQVEKLTRGQLFLFLKKCAEKFSKAEMEPGTAVGALCAQSIGEPGTDANNFHEVLKKF